MSCRIPVGLCRCGSSSRLQAQATVAHLIGFSVLASSIYLEALVRSLIGVELSVHTVNDS
jgi:hypothetical protein